MRYGSVCSGIEAATMAWHPLGWESAFFSEIEAAPRAVLSHHYPDVPLHGDFTTIGADEYGPIDLLVGGTPCQSFSVAGLRGGIHDDRGNLALEFLRLADRTRPRWVVWENVPGVFSALSHDAPDYRPPEIDLDSGDGPEDGEEIVVEDSYDADESHAFACFLAGLSELGYGFAYRVLDAQYAGVPQRRRRVFVVGYLGDWRRAAAVLFERYSLQGHSAPSRQAGPSVAALTANGVGTCGADDNQGQAGHLIHCERISRSLTACHTATGRLDPNEMEFVAYQTSGNCGAWETGDKTGALDTGTDPNSHVIAFNITPSNSNKDFNARPSDRAQALTAGGNRPSARGGDLIAGTAVRRLTPRECERLQGFPDDFTLVPYRKAMMADGPRYKMLGNSMAVPVMAWIGERIQMVEAIGAERLAA